MSESNKTYRIRTEVGTDQNIVVNLDQDYNTFEILSLKLSQEETYRLQTVNYGVIAGRVLANGGFGVPNAKISIFIETDEAAYKDVVLAQLYPYTTTRDEVDGIRYNLLPDKQVDECHRVVGTFPNKTYVLDNDDIIEIFDKYYKYTTRTNNAGDYLICGVPVGQQTVHMDLDLSDCGILSQRPRDFYYKGYNVEQFENANQFKTSPNLDSLSQIFSQDQPVNVIPFWGNRGEGESVGITRCDIKVNFKFEPTCVFMGSIISDSASNGISKKCIPTNTMGAMDELVTGEGTIEMIRKTPEGNIEELRIKGTELINSDGVWCYQIPMNLNYMMTDEYGNMVPTDDPNKGIPTRTSVRFRISMHDTEENTDNYFLSKVLVPNNPQDEDEVDYNFGSSTKDTSFRDLFWNNVYSVKSYIPRFQHSSNIKEERFTGIKHCNINGNNNPIPYNNIRIRLPLMFTLLCALIRAYIFLIAFLNGALYTIVDGICAAACSMAGNFHIDQQIWNAMKSVKYVVLTEGLCPDLENWYFVPTKAYQQRDEFPFWGTWDCIPKKGGNGFDIPISPWNKTWQSLIATGETYDESRDDKSIDIKNRSDLASDNAYCMTVRTDYLESCIEMNLAQEYRVINFDFYNDWLNGTIYLPRWNKFVTRKRNYLFGLIKRPAKIKGCLTNPEDGSTSIPFGRTRRYTQQCSLVYTNANNKLRIKNEWGCGTNPNLQRCHKRPGLKQLSIFGNNNGGIIKEKITSKGQFVYYIKPCEWVTPYEDGKKKVNLFATDIILLGTLNDCSQDGLPQAFKHLTSTSYIMPTNLALTNMEDNGELYVAQVDGTMCTQNKNQNSDYKAGIQQLDDREGGKTFAATESALTNTENYLVHDELDDYVPLTEASGIAWNYSGPDQENPFFNNSGAYQPGGHFLGMSCVNAQTNIKSCVNLSRICEMGTSMSQRNTVVRRTIKSSSTEFNYKYTYYIPTGLISKDYIVDEDFRAMFATLNHRRLIADSVDEKTGYPKYSFAYKNPNGFDGAIENAKNSSGFTFIRQEYYNDKKDDLINIDPNMSRGSDYDDEIKNNSFTRTQLDISEDYLSFRLGIDRDGVNALVTKIGDRMFKNKDSLLITQSLTGIEVMLGVRSSQTVLPNQYVFPMYENSFYFYFGLHPGATALDELNKQFFASCESKKD